MVGSVHNGMHNDLTLHDLPLPLGREIADAAPRACAVGSSRYDPSYADADA